MKKVKALPPVTPPAIAAKNRIWLLAIAGIVVTLLVAAGVLFFWPRDIARTPPGPAPAGMVWIPGGEFLMGGKIETLSGIAKDSLPIHGVYVDGFWMDQHEVTNEKWAVFAKETGYLTVAEQKPDPRELPLASEEELKEPFSLVFTPPKEPVLNLRTATLAQLGWAARKGACWMRPEGAGSDIAGKDKYPAVHIAFVDAVEYCQWLSKKTSRKYRLPTEAEWEFAARGGLDQNRYTWGNEPNPGGKWMANTWQGKFPNENSKLDGFAGLAPVGSFPANGFGLYDMAGNAWEWCQDYYDDDYYSVSPKRNPRGPTLGLDFFESEGIKRVQRGGSFLCADNFCIRYQVAARHMSEEKSAANHIGFRCVCEAK